MKPTAIPNTTRSPKPSVSAIKPYRAKSAEVIRTYSNDNVNITITRYTGEELVYYAADIKLSSLSRFKTAFAFGMYEGKGRQYTSKIAAANNAVLAVNGDYYNFRDDGIILRNGVLYRNKPSDREALIINKSGDFIFESEAKVDANALVNEGVRHILSFGPALLINGSVQELPSEYFISMHAEAPRTAICQVGKLHYMFLVVDGRQAGYSLGVDLTDLAKIAKSLGCSSCYNLDGGGSSAMVFQGKIINRPCSDGKVIEERSISDIVYIGN